MMRRECLDILSKRFTDYLRAVAIGAYALVNRYSLARHHTRFTDLLVSKPLTAYKLLTQLFSPDSAAILIENMVRSATGSPELAIKLVNALRRNDEDKAKRLLDEACNMIKRKR
jgi:hypothetical protein